MRGRPTPLLVALATLSGWALFLGIVSSRSELVVVAIPLVVALLSGSRPTAPSALQLDTALSATRLVEGDSLTLSITLASNVRIPVPLIEIFLPLPDTLQLSSGNRHSFASLGAGEPLRLVFELRSMARSRASIGRFHVRTSDRGHLYDIEMQVGTSSTVYTYPRIPRVRHLPRPDRTRSSFGNYVAPQLGTGLEPGEVRPFAPGDRVRQVNWPVSLRSGRLYTTQFHQERNADVVLLLDSLAETGTRPNSSLDMSVRAAAGLATAYLARKDRVGLIEYGGYLRWIKPTSGRQHMQGFLEAVLPTEIVFTYAAKDLALLPRGVLPRRAFVIGISPLIDDRFLTAIVDLAGRGYDLLLLVVSPTELTRRAVRSSPLTDLAFRLWKLERRARLHELRRKGIAVVEWDPQGSLEGALASIRPRIRAGGVAR